MRGNKTYTLKDKERQVLHFEEKSAYEMNFIERT